MGTETSGAERWLAAIVESSDDAIIGESLEGVVTSWNRGAERIFGYTAEEAAGRSISSLIWPGNEQGDEDLLRRVVRGERVDHIETVRRHKNGTKVLVSLSMSPILDSSGKLIGIAKIARDITSRVAMEQSILASSNRVRLLTEQEAEARAASLANQRFRQLIEDAPDGIVQVDGAGMIIVSNRAAERLFGYSHDELIGRSVDVLVPDAYRARHAEYRANFVKANVARPMGIGLDLRARRKDGSEFPVEVSLSPVTSEAGVRVTAVIRDVTERRRVEEQVRSLQESYMAELKDRQREAERLNHLKNEFLASVSHELRTPLHTILGFTDLLGEELEGTLNETQRAFVRHIHRDSEHLLGLINDVLDLSRIESGGLRLHTESLSVREAILEAVSGIKPHADAKPVEVRADDPGDLRVIADSVRLRQILYNLLSNAVKFTAVGGSVTVGAEGNGTAVRVTVTDTGIGMSQEEQAQIFDRFYQVSSKTGGTGLGLAICKQLVEIQGGSISVESTLGAGSKFHFELPRA
ncbi:MAG TPA: PAS domain S-box protein [Acidobacteriaceae bacterium]|nr:PAS domain S-box protein [Acidobacteriaceae bacterium]